ncbi:hypothetical protein CDD82_5308 [Ophiocordyceps australis]|uniref:Uncharacterized protein n=1 Tax=Ophiocordyceps australis TaxID=1399860 RepID=A0A2C5XIL0_9HYPO|nr:hypothetical protein CDD82_5308 [Ophiocordyceps australis]
MADFLASFGFGAQPDEAQSAPPACGSIEELQLRLGQIVAEKATDQRAEHVATTLHLGSDAQITLSLSATENGMLEGLNNLDPCLGGLASVDQGTDSSGEHTMRVVTAADVLCNQPLDKPILQTAVAKNIVSAIGTADGCEWLLREMSRASPGWIFTYICKDSCQQWTRQNKNKAVPIIGDYTQRDGDQTLMSRPAFDCRGNIKVSLHRDSPSISIKYQHTRLHKTVAQLAELFKPAPRQLPVRKEPKQKTPKKPASARKRRASGTPGEQAGSKPKRRRKSKQGKAQDSNGETGAVGPAHTEGGGEAAAMAGDKGRTESWSTPAAFPINVSHEEAARRKEVATKMLAEAGVDPESLSTDQFTIFSNQSPDLQKESLNMLVKYGAERLRIVHPANKDGSGSKGASASSAAATETRAPSSKPGPSGPLTTNELVPRGEDGHVQEKQASSPSKPRRNKTGKSRAACVECKSRKLKTDGLGCVYPPQRPRSSVKSNAIVGAEDEDEDQEGQGRGADGRGSGRI